MSIYQRWLVALVFFTFLLTIVRPGCVLKGICHRYNDRTASPCLVEREEDRQPHLFKREDHPEEYDKLSKYCSHLFPPDGQATVCCTVTQGIGMVNQVMQAHMLLGRCPSCFDNFAKIWCEFSCNPRQDEFVRILESRAVQTPNQVYNRSAEVYGSRYLYKNEFNISRRFAQGMFDSCRNVRFGAGAALRLMVLDASDVSLSSWLTFQGTRNMQLLINMYTKFNLLDDKETKVPMDFARCDQSSGPNQPICAASDCVIESNQQLIDESQVPKTSNRALNIQVPSIEWCAKVVYCCIVTSLVVLVLKCSCHHRGSSQNCSFRHSTDANDAPITVVFEETCHLYAKTVRKYPLYCIAIGVTIAGLACIGNSNFRPARDAMDLLTSSESLSRIHETDMASLFGPLYRIEQVIIHANGFGNNNDSILNGPIFQESVFLKTFQLIESIYSISAGGVDFESVCYRPLGKTHGCLMMSPTNYFQNSLEMFRNASILEPEDGDGDVDDFDYFDSNSLVSPYWIHLEQCIRQPVRQKTDIGMSCFGTFGGPVEPFMVFSDGRWYDSTTDNDQFFSSKTMVITLAINNDGEASISWEQEFIKLMRSFRIDGCNISFMSESSISSEIQVEAQRDTLTTIIVCLVVMGWLLLTLGNYSFPKRSILSYIVHHKFALAIATVLVSIVSSWCSVGVFSMFDVHITDNAMVVLFFIVTCIGINRSYITVRGFRNYSVSETDINVMIVDVIANCLPIVITSSLICIMCFVLAGGAPYIAVKMPIVEDFARHAGLAIFFDTLFYLLIMLPLFQYDAYQQLKGRTQFCIPYEQTDSSTERDDGDERLFHGPIYGCVARVAPLMMSNPARYFIYGLFSMSVIVVSYVSLIHTFGFDQTSAFAESSYLTEHFRKMDKFVNMGPPVYFVIKGDINWRSEKVQNSFCTLPGCDTDSVGNLLRYAAASRRDQNESTYFSGDVHNWIDNYLQFLDPRGSCCRYDYNRFDYCAANESCKPCVVERKSTRPSRFEFDRHLKKFLETVPDNDCAHGGKALAGWSIATKSSTEIKAVRLMTLFKKLDLSNSTLLYRAMIYARFIASKIRDKINDTNVEVYAYSSFFPYYEQYSTVGETLCTLLLLVLFVVFLTTFMFLKVNCRGSLVAVIIMLSAFLHLMSWMYFWHIEVNLLSVNNIAMALGITVEFIIPILHGFYNSNKREPVEKAVEAIVTNGSTILSGILPAILLTSCVLLFAQSEILKTYFGYQLLGIALVSTVHVVVYLPANLILLSSRAIKSADSMDEPLIENEEESRNGSDLSSVSTAVERF